jgi:HK97 family phage major capsid protein
MSASSDERVIKVPKLYRSLPVERAGIDESKRTIRLSFSSETPCERYFGVETLGHAPEEVDLSRLNGGGALLRQHNPDQQVGVVERAWTEGTKGYAEVRFSRSQSGESEWQDVKDGIRTLCSVGYEIQAMKEIEKKDEISSFRVTRWKPYEISLVSVPMDPTVGIGRAAETFEVEIERKDMKPLLDPSPAISPAGGSSAIAPAPNPEPPAPRSQDDKKRIDKILTLTKTFHVELDEATKAIRDGMSCEDFQESILNKRFKTMPAPINPEIGMTRQEVRGYSLLRAIQRIANKQPLDGIEKEASEAVAKKLKREPEGFFIPHDISSSSYLGLADSQAMTRGEVISLVRAMNVTTPPGAQGGYLVPTQLLADSMIDLLRNKMVVATLGAKVLSGLSGNIAIPKQIGGATAYWLGETAEVTLSQATFAQLALVPHRLAAATAYTKQLLFQSSIGVEAFVREDLMAVLALAKDLAAITGTGTLGEPLGIMNTPGVNTVTFAGPATWAKIVQFETELANDNAHMGALAFLTTPAVRGKWKTIEKSASTGNYLWSDENTVNGYRIEATKQVPGDKVIFGNWNDLIIADWDGIDVVVDPYTLAAFNQIRIIVQLHTDFGVRHAESFVVSTDTGAA